MNYINLAAVRTCTEAEGPGKRFAIWCQGCYKKCPDCCNEKMQGLVPRYIVSTEDIIDLINKSLIENKIEGVTFLGGEPMLQAEALCDIARWCHLNNLSVIAFSGYLYSELQQMNNNSVNKLLEQLDILIDGPFIKEQIDTERNWIGSKNQIVHFFSDFYKPGIEFEKSEHKMEVLVSEKELLMNGWPFIFKK